MNFNKCATSAAAILNKIRMSGILRPQGGVRFILKDDITRFGLNEALKHLSDVYATKVEKICWKPKFCFVSGKFIFLKKAVCIDLEHIYDDILIEHLGCIWVDSKIYTFEMLR